METVIALVTQMSNRTKGTSWPRLHTTLHNPFSNSLQKFLCYCCTKRCLQSWRKTFYFDRTIYSPVMVKIGGWWTKASTPDGSTPALKKKHEKACRLNEGPL